MECPQIPIVNGEEFAQRILSPQKHERIPLSGSIEVTSRCNLRCVHCYISCPMNDPSAISEELNLEFLKNIIDQMVDEGCLWLLITGGEPFVRADFLDFYVYARKKGLFITLFTNGTLINDSIADKLAEFGPSLLEITLYGRTEKTFESVTRVPGSYRRCMQGIELLMVRGINLGLKTMIITLNKHELWEMKKFAEELGVDFRFDPMINARVDGGRDPLKYRLSPEEIVALDLADDQRLKSMRTFYEKHKQIAPTEYVYSCGAGRGTFHIDSRGKLSACMMSRTPSWNLRSGNFNDGWRNFFPKILSQKKQIISRCSECKLFGFCDQCPGWANLEHGNPELPVDYLCNVAQLRAKLLEQI